MNKGFSLIEVLVSLALFAIVVTMSVGTLVSMLAANEEAQFSREIMDQLGFALDELVREARTGSNFYCANDISSIVESGSSATQDCTSNASGFAFVEGGRSLTGRAGCATANKRIGYQLESGQIVRYTCDQEVSAVTPDSMTIQSIDFYVTGSSPADEVAPYMTVFIEGYYELLDGSRETFVIQSAAAQRLLDV